MKASALVPAVLAGCAGEESEREGRAQTPETTTPADELPLAHVSKSPGEPTADAPAVLLLHGLGGDERQLLPHAENLPDDLHVLGVRGPHSATRNGYAWMGPGSKPFARSIELLADFAERVPEAYGVDPERIGLFGFSQGAKAALAALVEEPERFRWAVSLNGFLPRGHDDADTLARARGKSAFVGVGEKDSIIGPQYGEKSAARLDDAGLDVTFRSYPVSHRVSDAAVEDVAEWLGPRR
ncbi:alpha/beta hydrolase [Halopelagius fulvigenes]|uniref:Alpha/beta hydrolase n=1 Tax=Halopelagius fulvigenes TaxID=1198324 RepID=A0ABD5U1C5_9EURY